MSERGWKVPTKEGKEEACRCIIYFFPNHRNQEPTALSREIPTVKCIQFEFRLHKSFVHSLRNGIIWLFFKFLQTVFFLSLLLSLNVFMGEDFTRNNYVCMYGTKLSILCANYES